jgi:hypothetical protein
VAEAHESAEAQDEVEAYRRDGEDHDAREERDVVGLADQRATSPAPARGRRGSPRPRTSRIDTREVAAIAALSVPDREQALRPERQHHGHEHVDEHRRDRRARSLRDGALEESRRERGRNARPMVSTMPTMSAP